MTVDTSQMATRRELPLQSDDALRVDARVNRHRILEAASELLAADGIDVPVATIARRAGVGVATLYRRFPTRDALITEVFAMRAAACLASIDAALTDCDPWRGFCMVIENVCADQIIHRGFTDAFVAEFPAAADLERRRSEAERRFAPLVERAKGVGKLRSDFESTDLEIVLLANGGITAPTMELALAASRRLTALLLESFRAEPSIHGRPLPHPVRTRLYLRGHLPHQHSQPAPTTRP